MEKVKVKILGISCAHRKGRNTSWLVQYSLKAAEKFGNRISEIADIETEFVDLGDKKIELCLQCREYCTPNRGLPWKGTEMPQDFGCMIKDDYLATELMPKVAGADGFIFGSPVFNLSITSRFRTVTERFTAGIWKGYFTNKPAGAITTATMAIGGQESCLKTMNNILRELEMVPVSWMHGAPSISGPPFGPLAYDDDGTQIGVKTDKLGQWWAVLVGRRVAEFAVMLKLAKRQLGDLYHREFIQVYHPPHGEEPWAWETLDKEAEEYLANLVPPPRKQQRAKFR